MSSKTIFVDSGNLVSFVSDIPTQNKEDILNSNLLAQLAASKQYPRFTDMTSWYKKYTELLGNLAWQGSSFHFESYVPTTDTFTIEEIVCMELKKIVSVQEVLIVINAIQTFEELPPFAKAAKVYEQSSHDRHTVNALVSVVGNSLTISTIGVSLSTVQNVTKIFSESYLTSSLNGDITLLQYEATLNEEVYSEIRQEVIEKLGVKIVENIIDIEKTKDASDNN